MDAVMQLARAASNHEYLPSTSTAANESAEGPEASGSSASGRTADRKRGPPGSSTQGTRSRRAKSSRLDEHEEGVEGHQAQHSHAQANPYDELLQPSPPPPMPHSHEGHAQTHAAEDDLRAAADQAAAAAAAAAAWAQNGGHLDGSLDPYSGNEFGGEAATQHQMHGGAALGAAGKVYEADGAAAAAAAAASQSPVDGVDDDGTGAAQKGGNSRPLSTTKRAAQNRAAQRAFRERRDRRVKELEDRAVRMEGLEAEYAGLQTRYAEALGIIEALRRENEILRGGSASGVSGAEIDPQLPPPHSPPVASDAQALQDLDQQSMGPEQPAAVQGDEGLKFPAEAHEEQGLNVVAEAAAEAARLGALVAAEVDSEHLATGQGVEESPVWTEHKVQENSAPTDESAQQPDPTGSRTRRSK
ncbi:unnamed protein product [Parajaminaea phylloscopi]